MSKEFKVGLLTVISGTILYLGFNYLKGKDFFSTTNKYYAIYANIDGLDVSNPVIVNGFAVGRVSRIQIVQELDNQILVELDVHGDVVLGDSTVATLTNEDFLGSKAILLEIGHVTTPAQHGDTLLAGFDKGLAALFERAQPLTDNIGITIGRINEILIGLEGAGEGLEKALTTFTNTMVHLESMLETNKPVVAEILTNVNISTEKLHQKMDQLDPILDNANTTLNKINALEVERTLQGVDELLAELTKLMEQINEGDGTMTKMIKEDSLYQNMNQALIDPDKLLIHFNENPKHFMAPLGKSKKKIEKEKAKKD